MDSLHLLLTLQEHDTHLDQIRHRRRSHPLREALAAAQQEAAGAQRVMENADAQRTAVGARQAALEAEVATLEDHLTSVERRLYSGEVSAARDLQALDEQAAVLRRKRSEMEDQLLVVMEEAEAADAEASEARVAADAAALKVETASADLAVVDAEIQQEEQAEMAERQEAAASIPADLLARYEKLRDRLGGVAVARLVNGVCGGCHLTLSATEMDRVRHLPTDQPVSCEQCGRILVRA